MHILVVAHLFFTIITLFALFLIFYQLNHDVFNHLSIMCLFLILGILYANLTNHPIIRNNLGYGL